MNSPKQISRDEFIKREIATWSEDYVFDLIDRGYEPVQLKVDNVLKWWWSHKPVTTKNPLTQDGIYDTVGSARLLAVSPVSASRG